MKKLIVSSMLIVVLLTSWAFSQNVAKDQAVTPEAMSFGGADDVAYAGALWKNMEDLGFNSIPGSLSSGKVPHGEVIEILEGKINEKLVIVKRNYDGEGISIKAVEADRAKYLTAITVMAKREKDYDPDNYDWFWVKYKPNGDLYTNPAGIPLAGQVAKDMPADCLACHKEQGLPTGCISCHQSAPAGTEMVFTHDTNSTIKITVVE